MKNFKVVKCLKNGEIVKYAVFEDGSRKNGFRQILRTENIFM